MTMVGLWRSCLVDAPLVLSFILLHLGDGLEAGQIAQQDSTSADWEADDGDLGVEMVPEKSYKPGGDSAEYSILYTTPHSENKLDSYTAVERRLQQLIDVHQTQIEHLEHLIQVFQHSVDKLQSGTTVMPPNDDASSAVEDDRRHEDVHTFQEGFGVPDNRLDIDDSKWTGETGDRKSTLTGTEDDATLKVRQRSPPPGSARGVANTGYGFTGSMTVARYKPTWSDYFQFLSAVKVGGEVTCLHMLPHDGEEGLSRYIAVGDNTGRVYIFLGHGDLLVDFATLSPSPITAMLSFPFPKNETVFVTGHSDGSVLVHRIWETIYNSPFGDDWCALSMEYVQPLVSPTSKDSMATGTQSNRVATLKMDEGGTDLNSKKIAGKPITNLEIYRVGQIRYILVADMEGKIQVFRENGNFYGMAESISRPLAFLRSPNTQRLLFLTETGAASLDLRSMTIRSGPCEGLNGSTVLAYAFDAAGRSKAYGFTAEGDMIYVALSGDTLHFECHVRTKKKLEIEEALTPHGIKGYLLVATPSQVFVYNTTLQVGLAYANIRVGDPRPLFKASIDEISLSFASTPIAKSRKPVMACNREKLVVLGFGDGYVGMYKSNLPVHKPPDFDSKLWGSPVFLSIVLLVGAWIYFGRKREGAPTWMSDVPLTSSSTAISGLGRSGLGDARESFRESGRFSSPSRAFNPNASSYSAANLKYRASTVDQSFRTSAGDTNFRPSTVDPNFGASTVDPSFRASAVEPTSYSVRRESPFSSSQPE